MSIRICYFALNKQLMKNVTIARGDTSGFKEFLSLQYYTLAQHIFY